MSEHSIVDFIEQDVVFLKMKKMVNTYSKELFFSNLEYKRIVNYNGQLLSELIQVQKWMYFSQDKDSIIISNSLTTLKKTLIEHIMNGEEKLKDIVEKEKANKTILKVYKKHK